MVSVILMEYIPERIAEVQKMSEPQKHGKQNAGRQYGHNERHTPYKVIHRVHNPRQ
jgi:hypothetical protein